MEQQCQKIFFMLDTDVICQHKIGGLTNSSPTLFHNHDGYELLLFLGGDTNYYTESCGKQLKRGELICTSPFTFHCASPQTPECYDRILINISDSFLKSLCSDLTDLSTCFYSSANALNIIRLSESEISQFIAYATALQEHLEYPHYGSDLLIKALLTQILVMVNLHTIERDMPPYPSLMPGLVADTFTYINEHLTEDLSLQSLSAHIHHNGDYISRCFKAVTGTSLQQFIIAKRISLAQKYLRQGNPPCDACYMAGFHNYSNFSRTFSKQIGLSPRQYQQQSSFLS